MDIFPENIFLRKLNTTKDQESKLAGVRKGGRGLRSKAREYKQRMRIRAQGDKGDGMGKRR